MNAVFKTWKTSRNLAAAYFDNYSLEQLNKIPAGFSNNLIWNIGHVIAAQQSLIYRLSSQPMLITEELFNTYKPGSKPTGQTTAAEAAELKHLLTALIEPAEKDFYSGKFTTFTERTTGTGFHLGNLEDAFEFNNYHEGLHLGFMMNIRKFV
ncbi:MAG: DinB family protein [Ferruginibacter sp.]